MLPSSATIECEKCKNRITVKLTFEEIESHNRGMGKETMHFAKDEFKCKCGQDITYGLTVSEYPSGSFNEPIDKISGGKFLDLN